MTTILTIPVDAVRARLDNGRLWEKGWGTYADPNAPTCLHGAIRYCQPVPGDAYLIEQVGARFGFGVTDNDEAADFAAVELMLVEHADITDDMLAATFGSQWEPIVALVRRSAVLTLDEETRLAAAWGARAAAWGVARDAAWDASAAWDAARDDAAWGVARDAASAWAAAWDVARIVARTAASAWDAARDAALALVVRDLIGRYGFTQAHYDTLTRPWATVIGPVHPDDAVVTA